MVNLIDLIRKKEVEFYGPSGKVPITFHDYGKWNWDLVDYLNSQSDSLIVKGDGLKSLLSFSGGICDMADFLVQLYSRAGEDCKYLIHADVVQMDRIIPHNKISISNLVGTIDFDATNWMKELNHFEREWNISLCEAISGLVGSPGYEWPINDKEFRSHVSRHARNFLIGTKKQLDRYELIVKNSPKKLRDRVKSNVEYFKRLL